MTVREKWYPELGDGDIHPRVHNICRRNRQGFKRLKDEGLNYDENREKYYSSILIECEVLPDDLPGRGVFYEEVK